MTVEIETFKKEDEKEYIRVRSPYNQMFVIRAKEIRGKFNGDKKAWEFPIKSQSKLEAILSEIYGTADSSKSEKVNIQLTFVESVKAEKNGIVLAGRLIVRGTERDSGATCGIDVSFESGEMGTDGSRKNWYTYISKDSVFEVFEFEKEALKILDKNNSVTYKIIED